MFKAITPKDIVYENRVITNIHGITFSKSKIHINRNIFIPISNVKTDIIFDNISIIETWDKYIYDLSKRFNVPIG